MDRSFSDLVDRLQQAVQPEEIFGALDGNDATALKRRYRELAAAVHPDHNANRAAEAKRAFQMLQTWYAQAQARLHQGVYGRRELITASTRLHEYKGYTAPLQGDLCDLFPCNISSGKVLLKVARSERNSDLMEAEAQALQRLDRELAGQPVRAHFPSMIEHFRLRDTQGHTHQVNVLQFATNVVSLEEVIRAYPKGIDAADAAWMFNRMLTALGVTHSLGLVHGAVLPTHVLIRSEDHNATLIDWCYSVPAGETIKAVSPVYAADYPPEVSGKQAATPATDIYLAAKTMVRLLGGDAASESLPPRVPKAIGALLRACMLPSPWRRSNDAWQVYEDFQEILGNLYGKRRFRPFAMPGQTPVTYN